MRLSWRRTRVLVPLALLVMILMRLVWMQLRDYATSITPIGAATIAALDSTTANQCKGLKEAVGPTIPWLPPVAAAWLLSPGHRYWTKAVCASDPLDDHQIVAANEWLFVFTVVAAAILARLTTRSWVFALIAATMLLSRGHLLADIGVFGNGQLAMASVTLFLTCGAHFLRSGALAATLTAGVVVLIASLVDRSLAILALVPPLSLGLVGLSSRTRGSDGPKGVSPDRGAMPARRPTSCASPVARQPGRLGTLTNWIFGTTPGSTSEAVQSGNGLPRPRGTLVRPLDEELIPWLLKPGRRLRLASFWMGLLLFCVAATAAVKVAYYGAPILPLTPGQGSAPLSFFTWFNLQGQKLDLHYGLSIIAMLLSVFVASDHGLPSFAETTSLILGALLITLLAGFALDQLDWHVLTASPESLSSLPIAPGSTWPGGHTDWPPADVVRPVLKWFEPTVLTMGIAALSHLLKVLDSRLGHRP